MNPRSGMDLGEDVVFQILLKLPVRPLLRLRCVCKDWCALIKSCGFKNAYLALRRAMAVDDQVVRVKFRRHYEHINSPYTISVTCWFDDYKTIIALSALAAPSTSSSSSCSNNNDDFELSGNYSGKLRIINHVDGIVCLINVDLYCDITHNWFDITLVNPALRETRKLPIPSFNLGGFKSFLQGCGFGYGYGNDVVDTVYKVVAIVTVYEEEGLTSPYKHIALVYYLNTHSWKILGDMSAFVPPFVCFASEESIFSHGSIHWCMHTSHVYDPQEDWILAFDTTNESFRVIQFPRGWKYYTRTRSDDGAMYPSLFTVDKSTIALVYSTNQICDHVRQQIQVWVMKEYGDRDSWTLQYSINTVPTFCSQPGSSCAISFWKKYKLLINSKHGSLMCYDLLKGQLDEEPERRSDLWGYLVTGHETLVSVKQVSFKKIKKKVQIFSHLCP